MTSNMIKAYGAGYRVFYVLNMVFLILLAALCIIPIINILAISFSLPEYASSGRVKLWPVGFNIQSYQMILKNNMFWKSFFISIKRVILGTSIGMFLTIITSYPLSRKTSYFKARRYYVWYFFFTMLFSGGLVPSFLMVYYTGLIDTIWALIIPRAVNIWNCILLLNFMRQLPKELEEAAFIDGAGHPRILWSIIVPLSMPCIATTALFTIVNHWNAWFDGMLYMNTADKYPLQTFLQYLISFDPTNLLKNGLTEKELGEINHVSPKTLKAAVIFISSAFILVIYPFLQKHFTQGIVLGSVKG